VEWIADLPVAEMARTRLGRMNLSLKDKKKHRAKSPVLMNKTPV
jgi:hypothetical protein